jgi:predicted glycogen debranching enzyme
LRSRVDGLRDPGPGWTLTETIEASFPAPGREWLETDGAGGFASGTAGLVRTRRYHSLLLTATHPPGGRFVLVNGFEAWAETPEGRYALSSQRYQPGVTHPGGIGRVREFDADPWPRWSFRLEDGTGVEHELFVSRARGCTVLRYRLSEKRPSVALWVRPLLSGRDYHALHRENASFNFNPQISGQQIVFRPYDGVPAIALISNGQYLHDPLWYRGFLYEQERERGLDDPEDLASPGLLRFDLSRDDAVLLLEARIPGRASIAEDDAVERLARTLRGTEERRRLAFPSRLQRAADDYIVRRGPGKTVVAGYPWFLDWGRDTFIAMRGLCLATGRLADAREILLQWASCVSEGMLPNRFADGSEPPEYNSVDASLWFIVAVHEFLDAAARKRKSVSHGVRRTLSEAVETILVAYAGATRYGIGAQADGLLAEGAAGLQLTWMDAKTGPYVVTPRIGKPVELQALWINSLRIGALTSGRWSGLAEHAAASFGERFWNPAGYLYDVVDCDHRPGTVDGRLRPNQILAVGGLPFPILAGDRARRVVDVVEERLLTPLGPRTLAPDDPDYHGRYEGGVAERDRAYHQGTAWPWLLGPFVEAWVRVRGRGAEVRREARERFLSPLFRHLGEAGLGHISEIADGDFPHSPRGCPFQAWSVGEALRLELAVLAETLSGAERSG